MLTFIIKATLFYYNWIVPNSDWTYANDILSMFVFYFERAASLTPK